MEGSSSSHVLTALLSLFIFTSHMNAISAAGVAGKPSSTEFIRTSCSATTYPTLCITSLSSHASAIQTSPKLLAHTALSVTLDTTQSTSAMMVKLSQSHGLSPREVAAMQDCVEEVGDSVDQLRRSLGEMNQIKGSNFALMMSDIQTWVSAALTDADTCSEGFSGNNVNGNMKNVVRGRIVNIAHLTSNALALINSYASTLHG
ncbi:21 kDa protein-like [Actinidia eriantha]|uniref:21 kDa protein-like n=1 Tax=Actinidia eriantha TaxID=165200 RepID=UPI00258C1DE0|nr:21 kDa protein-like [Actinidia eriantha]